MTKSNEGAATPATTERSGPARAWSDRFDPASWFGSELRDLLRGLDRGEGAIRIEERRDGDDLVIRAEMPGIDPERDVDITVANGVLDLRAERGSRRPATTRACTAASSATGRSGVRSRCPATSRPTP